MPHVEFVGETVVAPSFRIARVRGMFDLPAGDEIAGVRIEADLPTEGRDWKIGAIIGASGSGKTTIARLGWPEDYVQEVTWAHDLAVVDCFPERFSPAEITSALTSVGFSSPPAWLRPYRVLSTGQQFRANLALALAHLDDARTVVFDEFTSTVDRTVAAAVCTATDRHVRRSAGRFVAVSCHKDILAWLQPDWIYDTDEAEFTWGSNHPRPPVALCVREGSRAAWPMFRGNHYLTRELSPSCRVFLAYVTLGTAEQRLAGFFSIIPVAGRKGWWRGHRTVVLPDFQGLGIGNAMIERTAEALWRREHKRFRARTSAPALVAHRRRHPEMWRLSAAPTMAPPTSRTSMIPGHVRTSAGRLTTGWVYIPEGLR
jgi:GNAT superfamily N-acetyltransferase